MNKDVAKTIAVYLDQLGLGTIGTDIFVGQLNPTAQGLSVIRTGGTLSNYLPTEESIIEIYSKHQKAETAINSLEQAKRIIHRMHNTLVDGDYIYSILVIGDIQDVQRDERYDKLYKITVQVLHRDTGLIS